MKRETAISFSSIEDLRISLVRAQEAHHEYEQRTGKPDQDWARWYARWIVLRYGK